ncbi:RNA-directed DNA polymerase, partial [Tanacetum coccineum]
MELTTVSLHHIILKRVENLKILTEPLKESLKNVKDNPAIWGKKLDDALWAFRTAYKTPTRTTPYKLVYGKNCHLPFEIKHRAYWAMKNRNPDLITAGEKECSLEDISSSKRTKIKYLYILERKKEEKKGLMLKMTPKADAHLPWRFGKLKPRGDGPFRVLKKINDNEYKIELPDHYNVSATFNVADLSPYKGDSVDEPDSWSSLFQEGEDDADAVLKKFGVERYDPVNEQFDPNRHNAVFQVPDSSKPPNTVVPGYTLHERIIRPAEVGV